MNFRFQDRAEAGRLLAEKLKGHAGWGEVVILGLPRGGVPVAFEVARELHAPLGAFLVRKLGVPGHEELAMGAIASGSACFLNHAIIQTLGIPRETIDEVVAREQRELERLERDCRIAPFPELRDRVVILIDDGLATGASMRAAVTALREHHPARVVVAVPVAPPEIYREFCGVADEIVCVQTPKRFQGVGEWYVDFSQTSDDEVRALLEQAVKFPPATAEQLQEDL